MGERARGSSSVTVAIISDIHGNLAALNAVLADIERRGADRIACLGDVVSFGPFPAECVDAIACAREIVWIRGNHDRYVGEETFRTEAFRKRWPAGFVEGEEWSYDRLSAAQRSLLAGLPPVTSMDLNGTSIMLFHATRASDEELLWPGATDAELAERLGSGEIRAYGHIHQQFSRRVSGTLYLNPGSVGFPFDGAASAAYALLRATAGATSVELVRVEYDAGETISELERRSVPWRGPITAALRQSRSFFSDEVRTATDPRDYEIGPDSKDR